MQPLHFGHTLFFVLLFFNSYLSLEANLGVILPSLLHAGSGFPSRASMAPVLVAKMAFPHWIEIVCQHGKCGFFSDSPCDIISKNVGSGTSPARCKSWFYLLLSERPCINYKLPCASVSWSINGNHQSIYFIDWLYQPMKSDLKDSGT